MSDSQPLPAPRLDPERDRVIEQLTVHFAEDRIDANGLERRIDRVYAAQTLAEIQAVVSDLPAIQDPAAATGSTAAVPAHTRDNQVLFAFMGGTEKKGNWTPAKQVFGFAMMGGLALDFREARFAPGVTEVNVLAWMGGIEIVVPPGLRVECEGFGFMGGFDGHDQPGASSDPSQPTLRIRGLAFMGGIEVAERLPGESESDRKRRRKLERQERKRLGG